jgi:lysyl-tRNA synthetase class 2
VVNLKECKNVSLLQFIGVSDFLRVPGVRYKTKRGEQSVLAHALELTSKALRQHPTELIDENKRYRLRPVDMVTNPEVAEIFRNRAKIVKSVRQTLEDEYGFIEIDTPILQMVYGGANAKPFMTRVNALGTDAFLSISPELKLKLAMMGMLDRVYTVARNFRNEGIDRSHNPEFSMTEVYHAHWTAEDMMNLLEVIYRRACMAVHGKEIFVYQGTEIDLSKPWRRLKMRDGIREYLGLDVDAMSDAEIQKAIQDHGENYTGKWVRGLGIAKLFGAVEHNLIQPTFVIEYPIETTSLCKEDPQNPGWIKRSEPYMCGVEIANLYSEQNNPLVQRAAWEAERDYEDKHPMDVQFLMCQEFGMPNAGGLGFGMDRMVMLLLDQTKLREVIFEPLMKPVDDIGDMQPEVNS